MIGPILAALLTFQAIDAERPSALERPEALGAAAQVINDPARERPFRILIVGDSHTAADHISGALRERLQSRFGASARGVIQPALPFEGQTLRQASITYDGVTAFQGGDADQAAGLTGFIGRVSAGGGLALSVEPEAAFDRLTLCYLAEPGAGSVTVRMGSAEAGFTADAGERGPRCETVSSEVVQYAQVVIVGQPVRLFSWAAERSAGGGVSLSNLGVIGEQAGGLLSRDARVLQTELDAYRPDLVILAVGTNEGFDDRLDAADYARTYRDVLGLLRRLAPDAAILAVGPPDAATLRPDLYRAGGFDFYDLCFPLSEAERADYDRLVADRDPVLARWYAPPSLSIVRDIQRQAAAEAGVAFWDWEARMGGACSIDRMLRADPPAARSDHVHFNRVGGEVVGGWLADDLILAFGGEGD